MTFQKKIKSQKSKKAIRTFFCQKQITFRQLKENYPRIWKIFADLLKGASQSSGKFYKNGDDKGWELGDL